VFEHEFWTFFSRFISGLDNFFEQFFRMKCPNVSVWFLDIGAMNDSSQFSPEELLLFEQIAQDYKISKKEEKGCSE
jgi:hypothetical protein